MEFEITKIENKEQWEDFLKTLDPNIFVQSWNYGDFFRALGEEAFVLGIKKDGKLIGGSLIVTTTARRGRFLYLPYGPKLDFNDPEIWPAFVKELKKFAKEYKADFIRVSPFENDTPELAAKFKKVGFRPAPLHVLAETTWILELSPDTETLFKSMRDTTRNLINRGKREGVEIKMTQSEEALKRLNDLLQETASRHNFTPFSYKYMKAEFDAFQADNTVEIFEAYFEGKLVSSAVIFFYGDTAVYRHGASTSERIKCQPSYLLQWTAIQEAKKRGMKYYNFWGIAPQNASKKHPFAGITTFKTGFGGFQKDLLHCQDLPITFKYFLNWGVETLRRIKRGF